MRRFLAALCVGLLVVSAVTPVAAEQTIKERILQLAQGANLPKGSYQASCACSLSGGVTLMCNCANIQGRMFQTNMDVRNCLQPKDIKNCEGRLKCVGKGEEC